MTSGCYFDKSALGIAFVEEQTDILSLEIFSTDDPGKISSVTGRIKIQLPKIEEPKQPQLEKKESIPCEYHKSESKTPSSLISQPKSPEQ